MSKAGRARRSITLKVVNGQTVRADVYLKQIRLSLLLPYSEAFAYLTVSQAKRLHAGLGEVIAAAEAQAKKGAGR